MPSTRAKSPARSGRRGAVLMGANGECGGCMLVGTVAMRIRFLTAMNSAAALIVSLLFVVLLSSRNPDVVLERDLHVNLALVLGPVFPFLLLGAFVGRVLCLLLVFALTAAAIGLWRGEEWARKLEIGLLVGGGACLFASGVILLLVRPSFALVHLPLAIGMWAAAASLVPSRTRLAQLVGGALVISLLTFGVTVEIVGKGLSGLR